MTPFYKMLLIDRILENVSNSKINTKPRNTFLFIFHKYNMKIVNATTEVPGMSLEEAEKFLESKLNLQIATIMKKANPTYNLSGSTMTKTEKLTITTSKSARRLRISEIDLLFIFLYTMAESSIQGS